MSRKRRTRKKTRKGKATLEAAPSYGVLSQQPLYVLAFLSPLILFYEIGIVVTHAHNEVRAHRQFSNLFEVMGVGAVHLPAILLVVVLVLWHFIAGHSWRLRPGVLIGMAVEAVAWTLPFWLLGQLMAGLASVRPAAGMALTAGGSAGAASGGGEPEMVRYVLGVGAGVYEEMLFRFVGIAAVHLVAADLFGIREKHARVIAVIATALLFGLYHESTLARTPDTAHYIGLLSYYFVMGVYLGGVYIGRGLGIVVAVHALYNVILMAFA